MNPLRQLETQGQSVWLDFITRRFIAQGQLEKLIHEDGITGVTSNPTIFQKAISGSQDYDAAITLLRQKGKDAPAIFEALAVEDVRRACDVFRPVYEQTAGGDGYVSLEVNPHLARDAQGTLEEARRLFERVNRPNVMIKIPGTRESLPAIEQALGEGLNVNVTLIFSLKRYEEVLTAWLSGMERWSKKGKSLRSVASVASFFISRVDTLVDGELGKKQGSDPLLGKAAIANACLAYEIFEKMKAGERFKALQAKGAGVQRPLWASTSTKNPHYRDVIYVEELIGRQTINTLPLPTIEAFRDHGIVKAALPGNPAESRNLLARLESAGLSMDSVTRQLEEEGLKLFTDSYDSLMKTLEQKKETLKTVLQ
ncbi:MAG: transaldolase [Elusimicrobiota bacterium]